MNSQDNSTQDIINAAENAFQLPPSLRVFDPRRLVLGEIEDDEDIYANMPALSLPSTPREGSLTATHNVAEDENSDMSLCSDDEEEGEQDCCVCYKTKSDINTFVLPNCNHIICNTCFFRWLRTSPTCPMCRDDFTSWERVSDDTIGNDVRELTGLFKTVSREHNALTHKNNSIRHENYKLRRKRNTLFLENADLKSLNNELISGIVRRREYTEYIRGYNTAIMIGIGTTLLSCENDIQGENYKNGFCRGLLEREVVLEVLDITHDELLKVQPKITEKLFKTFEKHRHCEQRQKIVIRKRKRPSTVGTEIFEDLNLNGLFAEDEL
jgi:hypothetical protein